MILSHWIPEAISQRFSLFNIFVSVVFLVALNTRNAMVMCRTLKALQQLAKSADYIGQALVPYYRQLLPIFNMFKNNNRTLHYIVLVVKLSETCHKLWDDFHMNRFWFQLTPEMVLIITKDIKRILEIWFKRRWRYLKSGVVRMLLSISSIWFQPTNPASSKKHKHALIDIQ